VSAQSSVITVRLHFKYDGGTATAGELEIYDAAVALRGVSRALAITTHAFINEEVRVRGERAVGARILTHPPTRGSYDQLVTILLDPVALPSAIAIGVAGNALWDFIKVVWSRAAGILADPSTPTVRRLQDRIEPIVGDLEVALEPALRDMHRPIQTDRQVTMQLVRPRVGTIVTFDDETLSYITPSVEESDIVDVIGNVTRYNILSGYGRMYDDAAERTLPFQVEGDVLHTQRQLLTWSIDQTQRNLDGKLRFTVRPVRNLRDETRRYLVRGVQRLNTAPQRTDLG
jgi:hypothetical protein